MGQFLFSIPPILSKGIGIKNRPPMSILQNFSVEKLRYRLAQQEWVEFTLAVARSQSISRRNGDSHQFPLLCLAVALKMRSTSVCSKWRGGNRDLLYLLAASYWKLQRFNRYWVHSLFIYLLLYKNNYFGDIPVLLHYLNLHISLKLLSHTYHTWWLN